jgi:sugar phosphate isomerase/epimerase
MEVQYPKPIQTSSKMNFKNLVLFLLAGTLLFSCNSQSDTIAPGATLYTVRDLMEDDPKGVLKQLADLGYVNIEATSYRDGKFYGMAPTEFKTYLEQLGLVPLSVHQGGVTLENADQMIADSKAAGFRYFVIPIPPMGHFAFDPETRSMSMTGTVEEVADIINQIGEKCRAAGLEVLYHNHDFELKPDEDGVIPLEYFLEHTDPEVVNFQMDLYWMKRAGADPLDYFERYPGRFKSWHIKDMDSQGRFAPVGTGSIDFKRILAQKAQSGMEYYIVEQDMTFDGQEPLEALKISYKNLKEIGFRK